MTRDVVVGVRGEEGGSEEREGRELSFSSLLLVIEK